MRRIPIIENKTLQTIKRKLKFSSKNLVFYKLIIHQTMRQKMKEIHCDRF